MVDKESELYTDFLKALNGGATINFTMDEQGLVEEVSGNHDLLLMLLSMIVQRLNDEIDEALINKAVELGLGGVDLFEDFEVKVDTDA